MREKFFSYYRPTNDWFVQLWQTCFFVVDANVLLNLYRYSASTSEQLLVLLESVRERIWIPHQAALEYHQNRLDVISSETKTYSDTIKLCNSLRENLSSSRRHPFANDALVNDAIKLLYKLENDLGMRQFKRDELLSMDPLQNRISELFSQAVGDPLSNEIDSAVEREGEKRYKDKIPPGYKDIDKSDGRKYGDLRVWFQIIEWAKASQKNIVFITDDAKEDWWLIHSGKVIGPRPELIEEIVQKAGVMFYMYQPSQFMKHAQKYLNQSIERETIDEIQNLSDTQLNENIQEAEVELANQISSKYKALKKFVSNYSVINQILALYKKYGLAAYSVEGNPSVIPEKLLNKLEPLISRNQDAVKAIQAVHSMSPPIFEQHIQRTKISGEILILFPSNSTRY